MPAVRRHGAPWRSRASATQRWVWPTLAPPGDNRPMSRIHLRSWLPFLSWPRPSAALLRGEFWAGITVGLMLVPQGVAYAALAGMPLVTGIYASLLPALVAVLFSSSTRLGVGPTALTSLLIGTSLTGLAEPGSAQWVQMAVWIALMSGALQCVMGLARFGWVVNVVTSPVLSGFTQAAALLILASQLGALTGLRSEWGAFWATPSLGLFDAAALAFGLGSVVALVLAKRLKPTFPAALVVVTVAGAISWATGYADAGGVVVGHLPQGLPVLQWPGWLPLSGFTSLLMPVLVVTLVSFLETASSAKVESQRSSERWNENQDLVGQGLSKISSGLCGSFATSASFSRSAINLYAGAQSGWATVFSIAVVLVVLLWLTPALYYVPTSALSAIVVTAVFSLVKPSSVTRLWRVSRVEAVIAVVTFALTLATAPRMYWGVLAGLLMNLCHFLYQRLHPRIIEVGMHPDGSLRDRHLWNLVPIAPHVLAFRMDAELDFASASALERRVIEELGTHPNVRHLLLLAQPINRIDVTGLEVFTQLHALMLARGGTLHVSGLKLPVETALRKAGVIPAAAGLATYRTDADALVALQHPPGGQ